MNDDTYTFVPLSGDLAYTSSLVYASMAKSIRCEYNPQPDITAYELAQIIPYILGRPMYETDWEKLGAATRHLKRL